MVAPLIKSLYSPVTNTPVIGAAPNGDKSATCHPTGLHLLLAVNQLNDQDRTEVTRSHRKVTKK